MKTKTIFLTGVSRGCGRAMAERFIEAGHTVVGCARDAARIEALRDRYPAPHRFDAVDVADAEVVRAWAESALTTHGAPDLLINNAAIILDPAPLWTIEPADFSRIVDVNVKGTAYVVRYVVPAMVSARRGVIVNFSSGWGRSTDANVAPYCATKWAIEGLTQALSQELPDGMAAVALNPGIINTDMLRQCWGDGARRFPTPERWATRAVPFILALGPADNGRALSINE